MSWFDLRNMHTDRQNMYAKIYFIDTKTEKHYTHSKVKSRSVCIRVEINEKIKNMEIDIHLLIDDHKQSRGLMVIGD